jgi:tetratricopeptide (TPR) repeat protein
MRATLHGPAFTSYAGRFVWLGINYDDERNQDFLAKHLDAFPTLAIIDPTTERVTRLWTGGASPEQLAAFLDGTMADGDAVRTGDALLGTGDVKGAVDAYDRAVEAGGAGREHALEQLASALQLGDPKACVTRAAAEAPRMSRGHPFVTMALVGAGCARSDPALGASDGGKRIEALAAEAVALPAAWEDDRYQLYDVLYGLRTDAKDDAGAKAIAQRYLADIDSRPPPTSDDERMARDLARLRASLNLGAVDKAIPILEASERAMPRDPDASLRLATAYAAAGRTDDVIAATTRGLAREPKPTQTARLLGARAQAKAKRGDLAGARADLEAGLAAAAKIVQPTSREMTRGQLQHQLDAVK